MLIRAEILGTSRQQQTGADTQNSLADNPEP
jgi:hypothetical protein